MPEREVANDVKRREHRFFDDVSFKLAETPCSEKLRGQCRSFSFSAGIFIIIIISSISGRCSLFSFHSGCCHEPLHHGRGVRGPPFEDGGRAHCNEGPMLREFNEFEKRYGQKGKKKFSSFRSRVCACTCVCVSDLVFRKCDGRRRRLDHRIQTLEFY